MLRNQVVIIGMIARLLFLKFVITRDRAARTHADIALTPVNDDEDETLGLLTQTAGARPRKKIAELTGADRVRRSKECAEFG
jgi:hypothetical protein